MTTESQHAESAAGLRDVYRTPPELEFLPCAASAHKAVTAMSIAYGLMVSVIAVPRRLG